MGGEGLEIGRGRGGREGGRKEGKGGKEGEGRRGEGGGKGRGPPRVGSHPPMFEILKNTLTVNVMQNFVD